MNYSFVFSLFVRLLHFGDKYHFTFFRFIFFNIRLSLLVTICNLKKKMFVVQSWWGSKWCWCGDDDNDRNVHFEKFTMIFSRGKPLNHSLLYKVPQFAQFSTTTKKIHLICQFREKKILKNVFLVCLHRQHSFRKTCHAIWLCIFPLVLHITLMCTMENLFVR